MAVNHSGDSDSIGAITGNLLGCLSGESSIPPKWLAPLELRGVIAEVADDLYSCRDWLIWEYGGDKAVRERVWERYPGG